jgi:hypothetical protein
MLTAISFGVILNMLMDTSLLVTIAIFMWQEGTPQGLKIFCVVFNVLLILIHVIAHIHITTPDISQA